MAFIREYAARDMGDPFSLRVPKRVRKMQVGRALGKVARGIASVAAPVLSVIPGGALLSPLMQIAAKYGIPEEQMTGFARAYGLDVGDPGKSPKRKGAASGPKAKAAKKASKRASKIKMPPSKRKGAKFNLGKFAAGAGSAALGAAQHLSAMGISGEDIAKVLGGGTNLLASAQNVLTGEHDMPLPALAGFKLPGMHGHRRRMNPTNVKALRHSLRRVEGFQRIVKHVQKTLGPIARRVVGTAQSHSSHARGHKAGCGCAVCRRG